MKELVVIVYSLVYFGNSYQERYYLVDRNEDDGHCFVTLTKDEVSNYYKNGALIDTQRVYTKPIVNYR